MKTLTILTRLLFAPILLPIIILSVLLTDARILGWILRDYFNGN